MTPRIEVLERKRAELDAVIDRLNERIAYTKELLAIVDREIEAEPRRLRVVK